MAADRVSLRIAGESTDLFAGRALYWPARGRLVIADLHLGKGEVFRKSGISLPSGGTREDLARLTGLLAASAATNLWILGDVLHGPVAEARWRDAWDEWRSEHAAIRVAALPGNHDRALARSDLGIELMPERVIDGPFVFQHEPTDCDDGHVVCGHVHPVTALPGLAGRWPSFWLRTRSTVLPAFSAFTGGVRVVPGASVGVGVCAKGSIVLVKPAAPT